MCATRRPFQYWAKLPRAPRLLVSSRGAFCETDALPPFRDDSLLQNALRRPDKCDRLAMADAFLGCQRIRQMLTIAGPESRFCDNMSRRSCLRIGGLALGGLALPEILRAEAAAGVPRSSTSQKVAKGI